LYGESLAAQLNQWGATATVLPELPESERTAAIGDWLARQNARFGGPVENAS